MRMTDYAAIVCAELASIWAPEDVMSILKIVKQCVLTWIKYIDA